MTLMKFTTGLLILLAITIIAGIRISIKGRRRFDFWESVSFMRSLIRTSELSKTAYRNILDAFHEFSLLPYKDERVYKELIKEFLTKYDKFLTYSEPKVRITTDKTAGDEDQYNYKIQFNDQNIYQNSIN